MSTKEILFTLSLSISFPLVSALISLWRIDRQRSRIMPLAICVGLGFIVEMMDFQTNSSRVFNYITNSYILIKTLLFLLQYSIWNDSIKSKSWKALGIVTCLVWLSTTIIIGIENRNAIFIIFYSFLLTVIGIDTLNNMFFSASLTSNKYIVIICIAYISYWTFAMLVELIIHNYNLFSLRFVANTFYIKSVLNFISNIIIAYGLLCIPRKPKYLLFFS